MTENKDSLCDRDKNKKNEAELEKDPEKDKTQQQHQQHHSAVQKEHQSKTEQHDR